MHKKCVIWCIIYYDNEGGKFVRATTLVFPVMEKPIQKILLGQKKQGFGVGKWNGFGGKIEDNETVLECAVRELREEAGLKTQKENLVWAGRIDFIFEEQPNLDHPVDIYLTWEWEGQLVETDEMKPKWFFAHEIPFSSMWEDDIHWIPKMLVGEKFTGKCIFFPDGEKVKAISFQNKH